MNSQSELPLSSLLERAQYIKKAMGNIEEEITQKTFSVTLDGVHVSIKGTCFIDSIHVDEALETRPISETLDLITQAVNKAVGEVDSRRKQAFSEISDNLQQSD